MAFSVNTNAGAFVALQSLNKTSQSLETTQERINTGLKVGSAKDNASVYAIAQNLRGDIAGLNAVKSSLDRAISTLDIAIAGGEAVADLLTELKEKAVAAKDTGLDTSSRTALNDEFTELRDQITSIVENAEFNGTNIIDGSGSNVTAITDSSADNTITITGQSLALGGSTITLSATAEISTAALASTAVTTLSTSASNLSTVLSSFGAGSTRLEIQRDFVGKLSDTIEVGIGNLVDADLAKESANLQALQVKQQLGLEALSIANQAPGAVLGLFQ